MRVDVGLVTYERLRRRPSFSTTTKTYPAPRTLASHRNVDSARYLVPIGDLSPIKAAPLTDAGLTPYHAVMHSLPKLKAHSTAVVLVLAGSDT